MNKYKFYDTSSLLLLSDEELCEKFIISSVTLAELENIKTSRNKDYEVKIAARHVLRKLTEEARDYEVVIYQPSHLELLKDYHFEVNDDIRILADALWADRNIAPDDITFVTNDLALRMIANLYFGSDSIQHITPKEDDYTGFKEVRMNENEMTAFYMEPNDNCFNLLQNEYLIVREADTNNIVDRLCWTGSEYRHLNYNNFKSKWFGDVRPV